MAQERVVKVTLTAQMQNYLAGMEKARKVTSETASEAKKLAETKQQFDQLGRTALAAGGLIAVGLGVAVAKFAQFDQAMSNVQAATHETAGNMQLLSDAALEAGASTVFSATEAAGAIEELAKAGISTTDILNGGLTGALDLAAAGGIDVAEAAGIAATTMQQFSLEGDQAAHVADLLAAGAGKAMGDVGDMSQALKQSGLVANQFGISVEETVGTLSAFASAGLLGSDAGTSFRTMLLRLANPTGEVKDLMKELRIEAYDAGGNFIGLAGLAGQLETGLAGLTEEQKQANLAMIFGQDAIRGATILYEEGAAGIAEWTSKVDDAGYAAETAQTRLDNLKGDLEALSGAVDTALISMGAAADGPLRAFVQVLTTLVDKFNELPDGGKQAVFWVGAFAAAGATALGSYLLLVPKVAEYQRALDVLGPSAQRASRAVAAIGKGVGIAAVAATAFTVAAVAMNDWAREVRGTDEAIAAATTTNRGFLDSMEALGVTSDATVGSVTRALDAMASGNVLGSVGMDILTLRDALAELQTGLVKLPLEDAVAKFQDWGDELGLSEAQMGTLLDEMPQLRDAIRDHLASTGEAADRQSVLNFALEEGADAVAADEEALRALAGQAASTGDEVDDLAEQIRNFGSATISVKEAQAGLEQALDDLTDSVATNGATLDIAEQAGRDNQAALIDLAEASKELAAATYEQSGSQEDANAIIADGRQKLIDMLAQFGITGDAAEAYADDLGLIPGNIDTLLQLTGVAAAKASIDSFIANYNGRSIKLGVSAETIVGNPSLGFPGRASGGAITGPGSATSDTAGLYALSNGEHVLTAADVAAMGGQHAVYAFREGLHSGRGVGSSITFAPVIHAAPGSDENAIADKVFRKIERELR